MIGLKYKSTATSFPSVNSLNSAMTPAPLLLNYLKKFLFVGRAQPHLLSCCSLTLSTFICKLSLAIFLPFYFFPFCFSCLLFLLLILPQKIPKSQLGEDGLLVGCGRDAEAGQKKGKTGSGCCLSGRGCLLAWGQGQLQFPRQC